MHDNQLCNPEAKFKQKFESIETVLMINASPRIFFSYPFSECSTSKGSKICIKKFLKAQKAPRIHQNAFNFAEQRQSI